MFYICTRNYAGNGLWCNGNTADFGSVVLGSSPSRPTKKNAPLLRGVFFIITPDPLIVIVSG